MSLFRKLFYKKPPDGLLEIWENIYVFDCCFSTDVFEEDDYKVYMGSTALQLRDHFPDASFMVFNFGKGEKESTIAHVLSKYDMTVMEYPRHYEGCPLLKVELIHHFLRSCESWLSLGQQNFLVMHSEQGGWPVLAFMLAGLLIYLKHYSGEQKTLEMVYRQAPRELLEFLSPLNPIPSQLRYLQYISRRNVTPEWPPSDRLLSLDCVILRMMPDFEGEGGCRPIFRIYGPDPLVPADHTAKVLFSTPKKSKFVRLYKQADCELAKIDMHCHIQGDVVLECISLDEDLEREVMMFRVMFNTAFIRSNILMLNRDQVDILWDAKDRFPKDFRAEVLFSEMDATMSLIPTEVSGCDEKEGLPVEAFVKVQEIFSHVDWQGMKGDAAHCALKQMTSSASPQKVEADCIPHDFIPNIPMEKRENDRANHSLSRNSEVIVNSLSPPSPSNNAPSILAQPANYNILSIVTPSTPPPMPLPLVPSSPLSSTTYDMKRSEIRPDLLFPTSTAITTLSSSPPSSRRSTQPQSPSTPSLPPPLPLSMPKALALQPSMLSANSTHLIPNSMPTTSIPAPLSSISPQSDTIMPVPSPKTAPPPTNFPPPRPPPPPPPGNLLLPYPSPLSTKRTASTTNILLLPPPPPPPPLPPLSRSSSSLVAFTSNVPPPPPPPDISLVPSPSHVHKETRTIGTTPSSIQSYCSPLISSATFAQSNIPSPPPLPPDNQFVPSFSHPSVKKASSKLSAPPHSMPRPPPPPPAPPAPPPPSLSRFASHQSGETASNSKKSLPIPPPPPPLTSRAKGSSEVSQSSSSGNKGSPINPVPPPPVSINMPPTLLGVKSRSTARSKSPRNLRVTQPSSKKASLKPLHWVKVTRAAHGSLWAEAQKSEESTKAPEIDMSELESLFSAVVSNSDASGFRKQSSQNSSLGAKSDKVHLIDLRRANNCEIMLTKVKMPLPDLMNSVLALDDFILDADQVDNLIKFCPTTEEMELLKGYNGDKENLGKCEQFFVELMKVPRVESKLRVLSFKIQFRSQVADLRTNLNIINYAAEEVRCSIKLKRIMQTILSLGNALNQGTARGSAIGFRLDSLLKLSDTRARNNKMTLMHYLCKVLADKLPEVLDFYKELVNLEPASKIQLKYLAEEMQAINKGLEKVEQELSSSGNDGPVSEIFHKTLKEFLVSSEAEVRSLTLLYSTVGRNADALVLYFGEDPARCPFEQVVSTLLSFTKMFERAHQENVKQLELEKKKAQKEAEREKLKIGAHK